MAISRRELLLGGPLCLIGSACMGQMLEQGNPFLRVAPPVPIFDAHAHVLAAPRKTGDGSYDIEADFAYRISVMETWGVTATVLMAPSRYPQARGIVDTRAQNDYVAWYRDMHRQHFPVGLGTVQPNQGTQAGIAEIRRMKRDLGLDGVVFHHHYHGVGIGDSRTIEFARECARQGMPVFVHTLIPGTHETAANLERLALAAPDTTIVALGAFSAERIRYELRSVAERCPNVLFETSYLNQMGETIAMYSREYGSERVLYGSGMDSDEDNMYLYPAGLIDVLESDQLTESDRANILWRNAERLFPALAALSTDSQAA